MNRPTEGTEPPKEAGPAGKAKRSYFVVIALLAAAMSTLPGFLYFELIVHVVAPYFSNDYSSQSFWIQTIASSSFLISPGLFFVILYFYGKRMQQYFADNHVRVILVLFLGSILGYVFYLSSFEIIQGQNPITSNLYWLSITLGAVSESLRNVFAGFSALGLSYLRARHLVKDVQDNTAARLQT